MIEIKEGDVVVDINDRVGFVKSVCDCDECKKRGFNEPEIFWLFNPNEYDFISNYEYRNGLEKRFKRIGRNEFTETKYEKPPLGLKPRKIHDNQRVKDIVAAMNRYIEVDKTIPSEWAEELWDILLRYED